MTNKLTQMSREEFMRKFIAGERDFSHVRIEGFDLTRFIFDYSKDLDTQMLGRAFYDSLDKQNPVEGDSTFRLNPVIFEGAELVGLNIQEAGMPYLYARDAVINGCSLWKMRLNNSDFQGASFRNSYLMACSFRDSNLTKCDFSEAILQECGFFNANLQYGNVSGATLYGAEFVETDLRGIDGLDTVKGLERAVFVRTKVDPTGMQTVKRRLPERFVVQ